MDRLMQVLAPQSVLGLLGRVVAFVATIAVANVAFSYFYVDHAVHELSYYVYHAIIVVGPFVGFFFVVMLFQMRLQQRLWQLSRIDGLTGLNNRNTFIDLTASYLARKNRGVLLLLDADHFKDINDQHGHQTGDVCLIAIAAHLSENLRDNDVVGRIGGEEFAVFLAGTELGQARVIAERFTKPVTFPSALDAQPISVTLSVGAVVAHEDIGLGTLMARADKALYHAKRTGRARLIVWDEVIAAEHVAA